jgi:hypothetical protein
MLYNSALFPELCNQQRKLAQTARGERNIGFNLIDVRLEAYLDANKEIEKKT